jgi:hypothetical protein
MNSPTVQTSTDAHFDLVERDTLQDKAERANKYASDLATQFAALPMAIFADVRSKKLKHRDVCLYAHLLVKMGTHRTAFSGISSLALLTGTYESSVKGSLSRLVECGHIERKRGKNTTHTACLTRLTAGEGASSTIQVKGTKIGEPPSKEIH